MCLDSARY